MIICAAIKIRAITLDGREVETVICGRRHGDCFCTIRDLGIKKKLSEVQGFINHNGVFLNREEAWEEAERCGQLSATTAWYKKDHGDVELFSEDLY